MTNKNVGVLKLTVEGKNYHFKVSIEDNKKILTGKKFFAIIYFSFK